MAGAVPALEELIKEYLVFRGFTATLKTFESDLKADKDKSFRVTRIVDQLLYYVTTYDVTSLRDYWGLLDRRFFKRVDYQHYSNVKKLETCLLRLYIVHALQNSKQDKATEFFEKYTMELQQLSEWREWFAIPFIKNPEQNAAFEMYFQRAWQETFYLSLHNFLITLFHHMPVPTLLKYDEERGNQQRLEAEIAKFKEQIVELAEENAELQRQKSKLIEEFENRKTQRSGTIEEEDADEFLVVPKPQTQKSVFQTMFNKKPKEKPGKIKKTKVPLKQQENSSPFRATQKNQQLVKQQQQIQQLHEQERMLHTLEEGYKLAKPQDFIQSQDIQIEPELSSKSTSIQEPEENLHGSLGKSVSFDSGINSKTQSKDDMDGSLRRAKTMPGRSRGSLSLKWETRKSDDTLQPKLIHFTDDGRPRPFIHLGQEEYREHHSAVLHCRFSSSGRSIASADADGIVKVWTNYPDIKTCATIMSKSPLLSLEWATKPDRLLLLGTANGKVRFYDTENKKTICDVPTEPQYPRVVSLSCSPTGTSFVCSAAAAKKTSVLRLGQGMSKYGDMSNLTAGGNSSSAGVLQYWDTKTMKVERQLTVEPVPTCINCTAFNHNGTLLVTGGADGMIRLFDMRNYDCLIAMQGHVGEVCSVQFSVDETTIYSMGIDGKFSQWSVHRMGKKVADLDIHDGAIFSDTESHTKLKSRGSYSGVSYGRLFAFDSEGQYVLTCGSQCGIIYKIDGQELTQVLSLPHHRQPVISVDWTSSLSCSTCLTGSVDGAIQVTSLLKQ